MRGFLTAGLALVALQVVVSRAEAAGRVEGFLGAVADGVRWALDPTVPAIPDIAGAYG